MANPLPKDPRSPEHSVAASIGESTQGLNLQKALSTTIFNRQSPIPVYLQVKYHFVHLISAGMLPPGSELPSVREAASQTKLAAATIQRVYSALREDGLIVSTAGQGTRVADVTRLPAPTSDASGIALQDLLRSSVSEARRMGFTARQVTAAVSNLLADQLAHRDGRRVLFTAESTDGANKYALIIGEALGPQLHCEAVELARLKECLAHSHGRGEEFDLVVTFVSSLQAVRALCTPLGIPVATLLAALPHEIADELRSIPRDRTVGVIAEPKYLPSALALVPTYRGTYENLLSASVDRTGEVTEVVQNSDVVVHTFGVRRSIARMGLSNKPTIEIGFQPTSDSIDHLASLLNISRSHWPLEMELDASVRAYEGAQIQHGFLE